MQWDEGLNLAVAISGAVTGRIALGWRAIDEFWVFPRVGVKVEQPSQGWATVLTSVENKGNRPKLISYAVLLIGPDAENPVVTANSLAILAGYEDKEITSLNDLEFVVTRSVVQDGNRLLIPLPFYYSEIADEILTYKVTLNVANLTKGMPLAVRFFRCFSHLDCIARHRIASLFRLRSMPRLRTLPDLSKPKCLSGKILNWLSHL